MPDPVERKPPNGRLNGAMRQILQQAAVLIVAAAIGGLFSYAVAIQEIKGAVALNANTISRIQEDITASAAARRELARQIEDLGSTVVELRVVIAALAVSVQRMDR